MAGLVASTGLVAPADLVAAVALGAGADLAAATDLVAAAGLLVAVTAPVEVPWLAATAMQKHLWRRPPARQLAASWHGARMRLQVAPPHHQESPQPWRSPRAQPLLAASPLAKRRQAAEVPSLARLPLPSRKIQHCRPHPVTAEEASLTESSAFQAQKAQRAALVAHQALHQAVNQAVALAVQPAALVAHQATVQLDAVRRLVVRELVISASMALLGRSTSRRLLQQLILAVSMDLEAAAA